jgi:tyrosine-protein phosphatase SIW14
MRRIALVCLLLLAVAGGRGLYAQSPQTPQATTVSLRSSFAEKVHIAGVPNAGKISEHLYRGAQPQAGGLERLKALGVTTIVDLRSEDPGAREQEKKEAESLGMHFVSIPVGGFSAPSTDQVALFLALLAGDSKETVFVHCHYGEDRTGVFVAMYRMGIEKWPVAQALNEMNYFGFRQFWQRTMASFVRNFPVLLASAPALQSWNVATPAVSVATPPN